MDSDTLFLCCLAGGYFGIGIVSGVIAAFVAEWAGLPPDDEIGLPGMLVFLWPLALVGLLFVALIWLPTGIAHGLKWMFGHRKPGLDEFDGF